MTLDPVQLALTQNRLDYITRQMGDVMVRTARSPIFSQAHDFTCFVCGPDGWLVSQADGIPIHSGGGGFAVRAVLRDFADDIRARRRLRAQRSVAGRRQPPARLGESHVPSSPPPPPMRGWSPLPATGRISPTSAAARPAPTTQLARDTWQEGVRLPAMKLVSRGKTRRDLWRLLLANSRTPELQDGDLHAMLGATRIGAERVTEFVAEVSVDQALALIRRHPRPRRAPDARGAGRPA